MSHWTLDDIGDQSGTTALVTGANSGLGFHTTLELSRRGARVLMACRNPAKADVAVARIKESAPQANVELVALDLASLDSVEQAAKEIATRVEHVDVLVNNAGIMAVDKGTTADGFESQFGTNHLGHFALTGRLLPLLLAAPAPRVVTISSFAHKLGKIDFEDLMSDKRYGRWAAYSKSKLANLLFAAELDRRAKGRLSSLAAHPGYASTHLQEGQGQAFFEGLMRFGNRMVAQSDAQGAWPQLRAATDPDVHSGDYLGPHKLLELRGHPVKVGRMRSAKNPEVAKRLWEVSEDLTGVSFAF